MCAVDGEHAALARADEERFEAATKVTRLADYIPLTQVAAELPRCRAGRKASISKVYRWTTTGCRGIILRSEQIGATRCTTRAWLSEFFAALTEARSASHPTRAGPLHPASRQSAARRRAAESAGRELDRAWGRKSRKSGPAAAGDDTATSDQTK
jgi:hypothetical protein